VSGQKWRGLGGGNFCLRTEVKPRRPVRSEQSRAEKLPFPLKVKKWCLQNQKI